MNKERCGLNVNGTNNQKKGFYTPMLNFYIVPSLTKLSMSGRVTGLRNLNLLKYETTILNFIISYRSF